MRLVKASGGGYNTDMNIMKELYSAGDIRRLENSIKGIRRILFVLGGAALAFCILLCCRTDTANAERMEIIVICVSIGAGWILLYLRRFVLIEQRHELSHAQMLQESERETICGKVEVSAEKLRIKNSIPFRNVTVETEREPRRVKVIETRVKELKKAGKELELQVANGYIAAYRTL